MKDAVQYSTYDWFKDIWLPAAGAILIPVAIAFFTWWFGASRSEKQKELRELRDNINLLSSILLSTFKSLLSLKKHFEDFKKVYSLEETPYNKMNKIDKCLFIDLPILNTIDISKYSPCINVYDNFVIDLMNIKQGCCILNGLILHRNEILKSIASCEDKHAQGVRIFDFVAEDTETNYSNLIRTNELILEIKKLIDKINTLETKIKDLKIEKVTFDAEQLALFTEIEN